MSEETDEYSFDKGSNMGVFREFFEFKPPNESVPVINMPENLWKTPQNPPKPEILFWLLP